jgi:hypothetical protein
MGIPALDRLGLKRVLDARSDRCAVRVGSGRKVQLCGYRLGCDLWRGTFRASGLAT